LAAERTGARLRAIPVTREGRLDYARLDELVSRRTKIIAVGHASNVTGAVAEVGRLRDAAQAVGALLLLDGAQRAPHGSLELAALGCDLYAFSAHKMFGPTGVGALWGRKDLLADLPPFLGGGEMIRRVELEQSSYAPPPHRFEAGTPAIGPAIGMGAAAAWLATLDWPALARQELALTARMLEGLARLPGVRVQGPLGTQGRLGVVSFTVEGVHPHDVCQMLDEYGVCLRGGHHCAQPLMDAFDLAATARASLAPYNDADDVDAMLAGLDRVIARLRPDRR
jgi:cysteine desulfurase/selenocysteine lyase